MKIDYWIASIIGVVTLYLASANLYTAFTIAQRLDKLYTRLIDVPEIYPFIDSVIKYGMITSACLVYIIIRTESNNDNNS